MDLNALQTFVSVVRSGGFAAAARQIDMPRSTVSLRMRSLEKALGVRLFKRSTRSFALTAEGVELYRRSADALHSLGEAIAGLSTSDGIHAGEIRLTVPADLPPGIVAGAIDEYRRHHPNVRFAVLLTNEVLDLVSENIDLALRIGAANPQNALVKGIIDMHFGFYASSEYVDQHGMPADIDAANTLIGPRELELRRLLTDALRDVAALPCFHIAVDNFALARELVLRNVGIALLPTGLCADVATGRVVPILPDRFAGSIRLQLTYPSRADLSPKVSAFASVLERHLTAFARQ